MTPDETIDLLRLELAAARITSHKALEGYQDKIDKLTAELATANKRIVYLEKRLSQAKIGVFVDTTSKQTVDVTVDVGKQ